VAARLIKTNPRLDPRRAAFLAEHWSKRGDDGLYHLLADPAHKMPGPLLYRLDEVMATWAQVRAKVLHVEAVNSPTLAHIAGDIPLPEFKARFNAFPDWREKLVEDAGHMVHHDQPEQIAALTEAFCA
ncbi:alpha/beta fold hydrolase, partial [Burkholderia stabilis]